MPTSLIYFFRQLFSGVWSRKFLLSLCILVLCIGGWALWRSLPKPGPTPTTFYECAALYPVSGTLPKTCRVPWGKTFVEYQGNFPQVSDEMHVNLAPAPVISSSPFTFTGFARVSWFGSNKTFEVDLITGTGETLTKARATEVENHMPPGAPPAVNNQFTVTLTFTRPAAGSQGALVLKKSGSTQTLIIPVFF